MHLDISEASTAPARFAQNWDTCWNTSKKDIKQGRNFLVCLLEKLVVLAAQMAATFPCTHLPLTAKATLNTLSLPVGKYGLVYYG